MVERAAPGTGPISRELEISMQKKGDIGSVAILMFILAFAVEETAGKERELTRLLARVIESARSTSA